MQANECQWCRELFWTTDADTEVCVTCIEGPDEEVRRQAAAEAAVRYMCKVRQTKPQRNCDAN